MKDCLKFVIKYVADWKDNLPADNSASLTTGQVVSGVLNWVYALAGLVAAGFIVYGGISYGVAQGEPGKIKQATHTIAYAVIGLVVVLIAAGITNFVVAVTNRTPAE
ncbi:MAG: pilin [Candidatus Saccharibacteria bacterium]|nr:pilin [Candidatus Saccharibacteria bacterium]